MLKNVLDDLDPKLTRVFLPWAIRHPRYLRSFIHLARSYTHTKRLREEAQLSNLMVPPFLILSITSRCNLHCAGCYAAAVGTISYESPRVLTPTILQLNREQWRKVISEASELGVFCFIIAGGEPFLFPGLLELFEEFKERFFLVFTNGTALTEADFARVKHLANVAIIVSIEGGQDVTDERRGQGVYEQASTALQRLGKMGVLTGISVTIDRLNYRHWMDATQLDRFIARGVRLGFLIEYIPTTPELASSSQPESSGGGIIDAVNMNQRAMNDDHGLMLTREERAMFREHILRYRAAKPIYLIHSPGDEEFFGGCVSAGRGFAHVTPAGDLTPCPVSNVATHNLLASSLREGLASPLFREIRANEHLLETEGTPCGLFAHPREVDALARAVNAYRTDYRERRSEVAFLHPPEALP